jgi:hypothetical protein
MIKDACNDILIFWTDLIKTQISTMFSRTTREYGTWRTKPLLSASCDQCIYPYQMLAKFMEIIVTQAKTFEGPETT